MRSILLSAVLLLLASTVTAAEPLRLLFLGDNKAHRPQERFAQLEPVLAAKGIALKYTDDPNHLAKDTLAGFDGLIVYANIDSITPAQEQALLEYVASGKGFIPLHCASFCFRNSPDVVALIGAQFQKHGGEVFRVQAAAPEHPIMQGYGGFESWDETYVHTKHNEKDRTVLEVRVQGGQADGKTQEPWTWVRTHGKGRVFYTAWGHDQRTFGNPGFQNLVERGIRWACGQDPAAAGPFADATQFTVPKMTALPADPKFEYVEVGPKIPNYTPGPRWGVQGQPHTKMQLPMSPAESMKRYSVPEGFSLELYAAEPDFVGKPIAMTWDERGRLWVCETYDYPNELQSPGQGRDRIRICEDTDGDGKADKFTVFTEKLSIPTAIAFHRGGAIVQNGTETLYLKDTTGDDVADVRETLITGWALGDTHGGVSNFQYGLDNWIWAMQGYNNSTPKYGNGKESTSFRMGFFRFKMESGASQNETVSDVEFLRSSNNNTWGLGISEEGLIFGSTANHNPSMFMPIPNRYYERVRGWSAEQLGMISDTWLFQAITDKIRQVDQFGGYTAGAGHALYTARNYPPQYWNKTAFVCEPTGHLIGTFLLKPDGTNFTSTSPMNLAASDDEWAAPIMAEVGPDGNVWILDWYNFIVQHNPTPAGFTTGKGNAYESDLRDKKHGRVYRLVYRGEQSARVSRDTKSAEGSAPLSIDRPQELVAALKRDNLFWRRHAQRLLVERGQTDVVPALLKLVNDQSTDAIGLNVGAMHALWTLHGLGVTGQPEGFAAVSKALKHPSAGVRRNAVQVLPATSDAVEVLLASKIVHDPEPQVQLAAFLAMSDLPPAKSAAQTTAAQSFNLVVMRDRGLADSVTAAAAAQGVGYLSAVCDTIQIMAAPLPADEAPVWGVIRRVAEHMARGRPTGEQVNELIAVLVRHPQVMAATLDGLSAGWPRGHVVSISPAAEDTLVKAFATSPVSAKGQIAKLAGSWGSQALEKYTAEIVAALLATVKDASKTDAERADAANELVAYQPASEEVVASLLSVLTPQTAPEFAGRVVDALGRSTAPNLGRALIDRTRSMTPTVRQSAVRVLLARPNTVGALLDAFDAGEVQLADLSLDQKQALSVHPERRIRERALQILRRQGGLPNADRQKVIDELHAVTEAKFDAAAGKELYKKQCAKCHMHSGEGQRIGPDLTGMAVHPKHELLIHILDPSRSVEGNFRIYTVQTADGRVLTGMLAGESKTAIELIDTEAKRHAIPREDIEELVGSSKSLMPEGFEKQMKPDEIGHLLEFLAQRGKYVPLDLRKVATVVSTKGMFWNETAAAERLIFSDWSPKTVDGVPFVLVDPDGDRVRNAVLLYSTNGSIPRTMPKSVELPCNMPAKAVHLLSGVSGWGFPIGEKGSQTLIVRLKYADGQVEDHPLLNGVHFADYIRVVDVPESKLAFRLRGQQIRYLSVEPKRDAMIKSVELVKGSDATAPVVMAVTMESR
jgi:putative membrane-bound dehydrogenase-like protein